MDRYAVPGGDDSQYQDGSDRTVLQNLLGVTSSEAMDRLETLSLADAEARALAWFEDDTPLTCELLRALHRDWLGQIYPFAGRYREVNLTKGDVTFCVAKYIPSQMDSFECDYLVPLTPCKALPIDELCDRVAAVHGEFLLIHPFREGNGRFARWIANLMTMQSGYPPPAYDVAGKDKELKRGRYFEALRKAYFDKNITDLSRLFRDWIARAEQGAP